MLECKANLASYRMQARADVFLILLVGQCSYNESSARCTEESHRSAGQQYKVRGFAQRNDSSIS